MQAQSTRERERRETDQLHLQVSGALNGRMGMWRGDNGQARGENRGEGGAHSQGRGEAGHTFRIKIPVLFLLEGVGHWWMRAQRA